MIRPWRTSSPSARSGAVTGPGAGSRWPARTGGPRGRRGCRRTGQLGRPASSTCSARLTKARAGPGGIRTRNTSSGSGSSKSSSTCSGRHDRCLGVGEHLDHDALVGGVPGQRHGAGAELLLDRLLERVAVVEAERRDGRDHRLAERAGHDLVEQLVDALGQRLHLLLLQRDAHDPRPGARLEEEGPLSGRPDGARDEPLRRVESVDERHGSHPRRWPKALRHHRPRRRRYGGSRVLFFAGGGASQDRSPAWVLVAST